MTLSPSRLFFLRANFKITSSVSAYVAMMASFLQRILCSRCWAVRTLALCTPRCRYTTSSASAETRDNNELVPERLYSQINIKVKGSDYMVLDSYCKFVTTAAKFLDINIGQKIALPTRVQKFTVLKSPHIYKKHRVQYEVKKITGTTADIFLEYTQRNLPEGVTMSVYQERLEALPALLKPPPPPPGEESSSKKR